MKEAGKQARNVCVGVVTQSRLLCKAAIKIISNYCNIPTRTIHWFALVCHWIYLSVVVSGFIESSGYMCWRGKAGKKELLVWLTWVCGSQVTEVRCRLLWRKHNILLFKNYV